MSEFAETGSERGNELRLGFLLMEINETRRRLRIDSSSLTKLPFSF